MRFLKAGVFGFLLSAGFLLNPAPLRAEYPAPRGFVNDFAGVVDRQAQQALTDLLQELEQKTGAQVAVAVVPSLDGQDVETYANELYEAWGIGQKATNRGALVLVAVEDRKVRIETGYGLEGILPDGLCGSIIDQYMIPYFKERRYAQGLWAGVGAVAGVIARDAGVVLGGGAAGTTEPSGDRSRTSNGVTLALVLLILLMNVFGLGGRRRRRGWGGRYYGGGFGGGFGGFGGGSGGGFGGFGGGSSGGGGAGRGW